MNSDGISGDGSPITIDPAAWRTDSLAVSVANDVPESDEGYEALCAATVMMVDDEPTTMEVIQAHLECAGYRNFVTTSESSQALDIFESEQPDVLLLDLHMPKVTGFEILARLRRHKSYRHIPVIVLTSSNDAETKLKALQLGATDFLAKPVDPSELALRLRNTLAAKAYQDRLTYYDPLTGLPNRRLLMDCLNWSVRCAHRDRAIAAVFHIDLDHFKKINDTLDHSVGDQLLVKVAERLRQCLPVASNLSLVEVNEPRAMVARVGGDEFNLVLPAMARTENAAITAGSILAVMREPFQVDGREVFITASIGIAVFPTDGEATDTLLKHASVAMNQAKQRGRNAYEFYSSKMNARALDRLNLENQLRRALDHEELELVYQPKVDFRSGRVIGSEALLRWHHPERGMVSPVEFIPLAEDTGLIVPFGAWVLHTACKQNKAWQIAGLGDLRVAVNVTAQQFRDNRLFGTVREALEASQLAPHYLTLEVTENTIMENRKENLQILHQIKAMGVKISVDDFGTGYSSLSYLTQLPLDELKIDRSFIKEIKSETVDAPIVSAILAMAHSLGLKVVAEGIETVQQLAFARDRGCDEFQGYLFSQPVNTREFPSQWERPCPGLSSDPAARSSLL